MLTTREMRIAQCTSFLFIHSESTQYASIIQAQTARNPWYPACGLFWLYEPLASHEMSTSVVTITSLLLLAESSSRLNPLPPIVMRPTLRSPSLTPEFAPFCLKPLEPPPFRPRTVLRAIVDIPSLSISGRQIGKQAAIRYTPGSHTVQMISSTAL